MVWKSEVSLFKKYVICLLGREYVDVVVIELLIDKDSSDIM